MDRRELIKAGALVSAGLAATAGPVIHDRMQQDTGDPIGKDTIRDL
jgi:hypothetical protein